MDINISNISPKAELDLIKWAQIVVEKFEYNLASRDLISSHELINSFASHVASEANNNSALISFGFLYYFKFIDMGVGRGVSYGDVGILREKRRAYGSAGVNPRRKIPVFNKTFYAQVLRLGELVALKYATQGAASVVKIIEKGN